MNYIFRAIEISADCAKKEVQAALFPAKKDFQKSFPFIILSIVGIVL